MHCLQSSVRSVLFTGTSTKPTTTRTMHFLTRLACSTRNTTLNSQCRQFTQSHNAAFRVASVQREDWKHPKKKQPDPADRIPVSVSEAVSSMTPEAQKEQDEMKKIASAPTPGRLAPSSILDDEVGESKVEEGETKYKDMSRDETLKSADLYPKEHVFMRNVRLRQIRRRGRLTKTERIIQTEKSHLLQSHFIKTSLKKLAPLARQIAGKPLQHAMTQMRFSPKKAAKSVLDHLEHARAQAVVMKDFDISKTYISQAFVGRGKPDTKWNHKARGRIDLMTLPYTCITVELKEEKTKERIEAEKQVRATRKKPWVPLPSRPIYGQHQYYTW